jgi:hypothetical protein
LRATMYVSYTPTLRKSEKASCQPIREQFSLFP